LRGLGTGQVPAEAVVEEGLRLVPPIVTWRRVAARDTRLGGVDIPAGRRGGLWLSRAGRGGGPAPDGVPAGEPGCRRRPALGAGAHRCVGAQLARMEAAVVVEQTAPLLREVEVVRAPWSPDNLSFRMPDALVVRSARAAAARVRHPGAAGTDRPARTATD